jgi:hypothetical protein
MTTTTKAPVAKNATKKTAKKADATPKVKPVNYREKVIGAAFFTLAAGVLSVSLPHLAEGMRETLGVSLYASVALAILFDLSQIAAEAFLLTLAKDDREKWTAKGIIVACTVVSIAYNGMAFVAHAQGGFGSLVAVLLAVLLPTGVLALSYLGGRAMFKK